MVIIFVVSIGDVAACQQTCCHITNGYNENNYHLLTYKFSKEQCTHPEDDLRIETCRSFLKILM
jgi:hypothetical protein